MGEYICDQCGKSFGSKGALNQHRSAKGHKGPKGKRVKSKKEQGKRGKKEQKKKHKLSSKARRMVFGVTILLILAGAGLGIFWYGQSRKVYPPTSIAGHVETYPPGRILDRPIPIVEQKHILEHTPNGRPGLIIQYNCERFDCEADLISNLASIAQGYEHLFLAPYPQMDAKIALTAWGKLEILEQFDEERILEFIRGNS